MNRLVNTTVLSNFAATQSLDLLHKTVGNLFFTSYVYDEVQNGLYAGYDYYTGIEKFIFPFTSQGWLHLISPSDDEILLTYTLSSKLHWGEASSLSVAKIRQWGFLTDDRAARTQATYWNIPISGTLGVLVLAVKREIISLREGNIVLQEMINTAHYRSPVFDLKHLI
ncbi:MAG: hypothetical protein KIH69_009170 [Anaerolineae bacterium]|nr:hypothetical protein [Anaerolineae bacterium]